MLQIISNYLGIFILGIGEVLFAKNVLNKSIEVNKLKFIIVFLISTILFLLVSTYLDEVLKTILLYVIHMFEYKTLFNIRYSKAMFLTILYSILIVVSEIVVLLTITNVGMDIIFCYDEFAGSILSNLTVCIFFLFLTMILKKCLRKVMNTEISHEIKILLLSLATFLCVIMIFYSAIRVYRFTNDILIYVIAMFVLISILYNLLKQMIENNRLMKEYDKLLEFMTTYENEIEKERISRHETKNEFLAIKAKLCDKQRNKEIVDYIDEILKEKIIVNQEKYAKFGYLPPNGIKGLCYFKVGEAEQLGINVSINISPIIKKSSIYELNIKNQRDLGKILGVFLDNAIEASNNSNKKQLGIETYVNKNKETKIIISNTFNNEINKTKMGKEKFTTKGKNRGHGLLLVKYIVENNKLFEIKTEIINDLYIQTLLIKNKV